MVLNQDLAFLIALIFSIVTKDFYENKQDRRRRKSCILTGSGFKFDI